MNACEEVRRLEHKKACRRCRCCRCCRCHCCRMQSHAPAAAVSDAMDGARSGMGPKLIQESMKVPGATCSTIFRCVMMLCLLLLTRPVAADGCCIPMPYASVSHLHRAEAAPQQTSHDRSADDARLAHRRILREATHPP
jgi:hypothetical protein